MDKREQIINNGTNIAELARQIESMLQECGVHNLDTLTRAMHRLHIGLRETAYLIEEEWYESGRLGRPFDTSDTQPCVLCNDHYPIPDKYTRGIRYEPVPGLGYVYLCWECVIALAKIIHQQLTSLSYNYLFLHIATSGNALAPAKQHNDGEERKQP